MLNVQNFINKYDNWKEILQGEPYCLKIQEQGNMIMFSCTNRSDKEAAPEICNEAHDLILQAGTYTILKKSLDPVPTLSECSLQSINWEFSSATEIIEGATAALYYAEGEWRVSTTGKFDNKAAYNSISKMCSERGLSFEYFNTQCTYNFVITPANEPVLVAVIDNRLLTEQDLPEALPTPNEYEHEDVGGYNTELDFLDSDCLGLVIKDNRNNRVKMLVQK